MRTTRSLPLVLLVLALAGGVYWMVWGGDQPQHPAAGSVVNEVEEPLPVADQTARTPANPEGAPIQGEQESSSRTALRTGNSSARVVDPDGNGIGGVEIVWRIDQGQPAGWQEMWSRPATLVRDDVPLDVANTTEEGGYGPPSLDADDWGQDWLAEDPVVAWFFRPGWLAAALVIAPNTPLEDWPHDVLLEPHPIVEVHLRNASGNAVEGAEVFLGGIANSNPLDGVTASKAPLDLALQSATTDAEGVASFAAIPGLIRVQARLGDRVALPYSGTNRSVIDLVLVEGFQVSGTLVLPDGETEQFSPRLHVAARRGGVWKDLVTLAIGPQKEWGPIELPLLEGAAEYSLELEAPPLRITRQFFDPPSAGEELFFALAPSRGEFMAVLPVEAETVQDPVAKRILGGRALLTVLLDGRRTQTWYGAREDGLIQINGLPPGLAWYEVFAPGYAPLLRTPTTLPGEGNNAWRVGLERSGTLRGRVVSGTDQQDAPIEEFDVILWPANNPLGRSVFHFAGRTDGSFEIDTVPNGEVAVTATTASRPAPLPILVNMDADQTTEVELTLPPGGPVQGRVLDLQTHEPIGGARVQLYVQGAAGAVVPWGAQRSIDATGRFSFPGSVPRENFFNFEARGYSSKYLSAIPDSNGVVDLGDIYLTRPGRLTVRLVGLDQRPDLDPGSLNLNLEGPSRLSSGVEALSDGSFGAVFEEVNSGSLWIDLWSGEFLIAEMSQVLAPGEDHQTNFVLSGGTNLEISVEGGSEEARKDALDLFVESQAADGSGYLYGHWISDDGPYLIPHVQGAHASVNLFGRDRAKRYGGLSVELEPGKTLQVAIDLDARPFTVRVLDKDEQPLAAAYVSLGVAGKEQTLFGIRTQSDGTAQFFGVPEEDILIGLEHSQAGRRFDIPVDGRQDEVTLSLDGTDTLEVLVTDDGVPLAGMDVSLFNTGGVWLVSCPTGSDGLARFENWAPSRVKLIVAGKGLMDYSEFVKIGAGLTHFQAKVWHTGDLDLQVLNEEGQPVAGATLQLVHLPSGVQPSTWIDEGKLPEQDFESDLAGHIRLVGLPHGAYSMTITTADQEPVQATANLIAGKLVHQTVQL